MKSISFLTQKSISKSNEISLKVKLKQGRHLFSKREATLGKPDVWEMYAVFLD